MKKQAGGTALGFVVGFVVGLAVALAVAAYITKVPIPFVDKEQSRTSEQDKAEQQKNQAWDPNMPLYDKDAAKPPVLPDAAPPQPAAAGDPLGDLVKARSEKATNAALYFVQAGAYSSADDADSQRAKLALGGLDNVKVSEGESAGRKVFRVRIGPLDDKATAEKMQQRLNTQGVKAVLVSEPR
jgi:cell division protein FtsN